MTHRESTGEIGFALTAVGRQLIDQLLRTLVNHVTHRLHGTGREGSARHLAEIAMHRRVGIDDDPHRTDALFLVDDTIGGQKRDPGLAQEELRCARDVLDFFLTCHGPERLEIVDFTSVDR